MEDSTAQLARSITLSASRQTYWTARLLVDRARVNDFFRAYAYFRWADDFIDVASRSKEERTSFAARQRTLIEQCYAGRAIKELSPYERILADLIEHDQEPNSGLQSFVRNMFAVLEFDARRRGRLISQQELDVYTERIAESVTDGLQFFIGHGHRYRSTANRLSAAYGAHITHLLRDMVSDTADGFVNIPREYLQAHAIGPNEMDSVPFRAWVQQRVERARAHFAAGQCYLDGLDVLRCKIAGHWYCARFEGILDTIERDGYRLRPEYKRRRLATSLGLIKTASVVTLRHIYRKILRLVRRR